MGAMPAMRAPAGLEEAPVSHVLDEGVLEHVLQVGKQRLLVDELQGLEVVQGVLQPLPDVGDAPEQAGSELAADHRRGLDGALPPLLQAVVAARGIHGALFAVGVLLVLSACSEDPLLPPSDDHLALGTWGGDDAGVIATDSVTHVHVDCTSGDMPGNIPLDEDGRFTVDGSYVLRAYPVMIGPALPAQFSGPVSGRTLTLAIAVNATLAEAGITVPFPQRDLHVRFPDALLAKDGKS